jgi:hypothetical protein
MQFACQGILRFKLLKLFEMSGVIENACGQADSLLQRLWCIGHTY